MTRRLAAGLGVAMLAVGGTMTAADRPVTGVAAPRIVDRVHLGPRVPDAAQLKGNVVLLFFWAHWCSECKAESR